MQKEKPRIKAEFFFLVEVTGLEPTTSWSLTKRATKLRYTSIKSISYYINYSLCVKRFFCPQTKFLAKSQILNVMRPHIMWGALYSEKTSRRTCKPGSVERGHLSTLTVTGKLKRYLRLYSGGQPIRIQPNLASDGVYMARGVTVPSVSSYLAFPPLPQMRRSISVALSLKSPSPDVIRRPALRCPDFPRRIRDAPRPRSPLEAVIL